MSPDGAAPFRALMAGRYPMADVRRHPRCCWRWRYAKEYRGYYVAWPVADYDGAPSVWMANYGDEHARRPDAEWRRCEAPSDD
jgi:hypothetical protein